MRTSHYKICLLRVPVYFKSLCLIKAASEVNITDISSKYQFLHLLEDFSFQKQRITKYKSWGVITSASTKREKVIDNKIHVFNEDVVLYINKNTDM